MKHIRYLILAGCLLWLAGTIAATPAAAKQSLIVSAAASLTQAMQQVGSRYESGQDRIGITFNFAASGALLQQIAHGAPVDIFMSANQAFMDRAAAQGLIRTSTRRDFARNQLVLAVARHAAADIRSLDDLLHPAVQRIAVGHPETVPAGRYARQALQAAKLWQPVQAKLIYGNSVRQVLDYLRRGEVDAGLVYATDAHFAGSSIIAVSAVPTRTPVVYCLAVTAGSANPVAARHFIDYLLGAEGQKLLSGFGFLGAGSNKK